MIHLFTGFDERWIRSAPRALQHEVYVLTGDGRPAIRLGSGTFDAVGAQAPPCTAIGRQPDNPHCPEINFRPSPLLEKRKMVRELG